MSSGRWLFGSFFLGGFECSTHLTPEGHRLDVVAASRHDVQAAEDYALCRAVGIRAVREAARWPIVDRGGRLDLAGVRDLARLGRQAGLTLIWDLMHYGYPDDLDPFSPAFVERFREYARAVARVVRAETDGPTWYTPINEISYHAFAGGSVGYFAPFGVGRGAEYKRVLVRASIAAANAIWEVDPAARILNVDPLIRVQPPPGRPDLQDQADHFNRHVVNETFDLLAGRREPELGGARAYLGVVGLNYYATNQWTIGTPEIPQRFVDWDEPGRVPLAELLLDIQDQYGGPLVIAETGNAAKGRAGWLRHLSSEVKRALERGVDVQGICLYPIVSTPDWEDPTASFEGGLFDIRPGANGHVARVLSAPAGVALREAQAVFDPNNLPAEPLAGESPPPSVPTVPIARPLDQARFRSDNFSYQVLLAGEALAVELYSFEPGTPPGPHRHASTEHVLTVIAGVATVAVGEHTVELHVGETVLVPAGQYHSIDNNHPERLIVQQVSAPKAWDARFGGPHPSTLG